MLEIQTISINFFIVCGTKLLCLLISIFRRGDRTARASVYENVPSPAADTQQHKEDVKKSAQSTASYQSRKEYCKSSFSNDQDQGRKGVLDPPHSFGNGSILSRANDSKSEYRWIKNYCEGSEGYDKHTVQDDTTGEGYPGTQQVSKKYSVWKFNDGVPSEISSRGLHSSEQHDNYLTPGRAGGEIIFNLIFYPHSFH